MQTETRFSVPSLLLPQPKLPRPDVGPLGPLFDGRRRTRLHQRDIAIWCGDMGEVEIVRDKHRLLFYNKEKVTETVDIRDENDFKRLMTHTATYYSLSVVFHNDQGQWSCVFRSG